MTYKNRNYGILVTNVNNIVSQATDKLKIWKQYIEQLFSDARPEQQVLVLNNTGPDVLKDEVHHAIQCTKSGKDPTKSILNYLNSSMTTVLIY